MPATRKAVRELPHGVLKRTACPACRQGKDRYAQGVVELHGEAWEDKRELVEGTIRNSERIARSRNDQERVLWSNTSRGILKYYVSLPELARRIGRVLQRAFHGQAEYVRTKRDPFIRVRVTLK